jgi:hypothetical protein
MEDLRNRLRELGLSEEQIKSTIAVISRWLAETYPVAGAMINSWLKNENII